MNVANDRLKGGAFVLNVVDALTDNTMLKSTSIVRDFLLFQSHSHEFFRSIGTEFSRREPIGPTEQPS
jgi:hypothetical protein